MAVVTDEVVELLFEVMGRMKAHFEAHTAALGLSSPQAHALRSLAASGELSQRELAMTLRCDASNVTGIVDRLEARGLVERRVSPADRRVKTLVVTSEGAQVHDRLARRVAEGAPMLNTLTAAEQRQLCGLLRKALG